MPLLEPLKVWARRLKRDVVTVSFAARDARTPLPVRLLALGIAAYALSPIDLIPDFIPVIGYLDDLLIVPLGLLLVMRLLPPEVLEASRLKAQAAVDRPRSTAAAVLIVAVWVASTGAVVYWWLHR